MIIYINIIGSDTKSTENCIVVGRPEHAIINKFYFELAKEIVKGANAPSIGDVKNKRLITDFEVGHEADFEEITNQWERVKQILLGEKPTGKQIIKLPPKYIEWLAYHSKPVYNEIAKSLAIREGTVEISIDKIYTNAIGFLVNNIDTTIHYDQFVVNDNLVDDNSQISKDIRKKIGEDVPFVPFDDYDKGSKKRAFVVAYHENGKADFYNQNGDVVDKGFENIGPVQGFFCKDGKYYVIKDHVLTEVALGDMAGANVENEERVMDNILILRKDYDCCAVGLDGTMLIQPGQFDGIKYLYNDDYIAVRNNDRKWGIWSLNKSELVIPLKYCEIRHLTLTERPYFGVKNKQGEYGVIDISGNVILDFDYDYIKDYVGELTGVGLFIVKKDDFFGVVNSDSEIIVPIEYDEVEWLWDSYYEKRLEPIFFFKVKDGEESGVYSSDGELVIPMDYDYDYDDIDLSISYNYNKIEAPYEYDDEIGSRPPYVYDLRNENCVFDCNGLRIEREDNGEYGCKNPRWHYLIDGNDNEIYSSFCNDFYRKGECYIEQQGFRRDKNVVYQMIDKNGNVCGIVPNGYHMGEMINGIAVACNWGGGDRTNVVYFINQNGKIIKTIDARALFPFDFKDGKLFYIDSQNNFGYYDTSLTEHILGKVPANIMEIECILSEEFILAKDKEEICSLINIKSGGIVKTPIDENGCVLTQISNSYSGIEIPGYYVLSEERRAGLIDRSGKVIVPFKYQMIYAL